MTPSDEHDELAELPAKDLDTDLPRQEGASKLVDEVAEGERQRRGQQKLLFGIVCVLVCLSFVVTGTLIALLGFGILDLPATGQVAAIAAFGVQPFLLIRGLTTSVYRGNSLRFSNKLDDTD